MCVRECVGKATVTKTINGAVSCAVIILVILIVIARYCYCCCLCCCCCCCCLLIAFSLAPAFWHSDNFRLLFWFRFAAVCTRLVAVCLLFIALTLTHSHSLTHTHTHTHSCYRVLSLSLSPIAFRTRTESAAGATGSACCPRRCECANIFTRCKKHKIEGSHSLPSPCTVVSLAQTHTKAQRVPTNLLSLSLTLSRSLSR